MTAVLVGTGMALSALTIQGMASAVGIETIGALLARRAVGTQLWRNGLATVVLIMILLTGHLAQMAVWAIAYVTAGEFGTFGVAFYHSAVNYTTLGYGDIVMSPRWRLLGPLEATTGTLAFGWSTAVIVTAVIRLVRYRHRAKLRQESRPRYVPVAILLILGWAAVAHAEDAPRAPAGSRTLADTPFQLILPREHLLGDWLGSRTWLEDLGITPTVTFVTNALGNPTGGKQQGFTGANNLGVDLLFDLNKLFGLAGGSFEISFSERFGSSLSREDIGNVFTVQQVFGGQTYRLVDMAYKQQLLDDHVEFRVGRIAAGDDFLVSPYDYVFVQRSLASSRRFSRRVARNLRTAALRSIEPSI